MDIKERIRGDFDKRTGELEYPKLRIKLSVYKHLPRLRAGRVSTSHKMSLKVYTTMLYMRSEDT